MKNNSLKLPLGIGIGLVVGTALTLAFTQPEFLGDLLAKPKNYTEPGKIHEDFENIIQESSILTHLLNKTLDYAKKDIITRINDFNFSDIHKETLEKATREIQKKATQIFGHYANSIQDIVTKK